MIKRIMAVGLLAVLLTGGLTSHATADNDRLVEFQGRQIDLKPYFEGFPYNGFRPFYEAGKLYYYHDGDTRTLRELDLDGDVDLSKGRVVCDIDFSTRNVWSMRYNDWDGKLYWIGDEKNDEIINLYSMDPKSGKVEKLTDVPYIFGYRHSPEGNRVAYIARLGDKDKRSGDFRVLDLQSGTETVLMTDSPNYRFTWTSPSWQPDGKGVAVTMLHGADRNKGNVFYLPLTGGYQNLTNPEKQRNWPNAYREWLGPQELLYTSNEDGFRNAYKYDLETRQSSQVTTFERDMGDSEIIEVDGKKYLFAVLQHPAENTIVIVDPADGKVLLEQAVDVNLSILDADGDRMMAYCTSAVEKFRIDEIKVSIKNGKPELEFDTRVSTPADLKDRIVNATVERIEYPTFDKDEKTGKTRMLHAFLYKPEKPLPKDQRMVMIQSFYGGSNNYSTRNHILAEAGIYVLSPSPRGSSGFGREFAALNDKDLGGNEIIDVIYAARWAQKNLGVPPERIGVFGGSHGGYATMRCLTFPGEVNGNKADFDWGFGLSHAGFSDIIQFYEFCNIPDWVILEAGDPATEADKLRDRSPLYHADKARGKLLLTHGTNDSRVPIDGSRAMADSLRAHGKDVTLIEFEGQGHGIKGLDRNIKYYRVWFEFLESVEKGNNERASAR